MALKKPSSSKKMGKKKKQETTGNGNSRLGKIAENQFSYDTKEFENRDFLSTVELLDTKAILMSRDSRLLWKMAIQAICKSWK